MNAPVTIHCEGDYRRAEERIAEQDRLLEQARYEIAHWKREAGQLVEQDVADAIQVHFHLTATEATICAGLYQRREKMTSSTTLEGLLEEERGCAVESNIVSVMILKIRHKLGDDAIQTVRGRGYRLTPSALKRLDRKLATTN